MISVPQLDATFAFSVSRVLQFVKGYAMNVLLERFVVSDVEKIVINELLHAQRAEPFRGGKIVVERDGVPQQQRQY